MKKYFENFDFSKFWDKEWIPLHKPTLEEIKNVEEKLEIKIPDSYKEFIQIQNGGLLFKRLIEINGENKSVFEIFGIGNDDSKNIDDRNKEEIQEFWEETGYEYKEINGKIGIKVRDNSYICDYDKDGNVIEYEETPVDDFTYRIIFGKEYGGHGIYYFDYSKNGKQNEPEIYFLDEVTVKFVAKEFETFIKNLKYDNYEEKEYLETKENIKSGKPYFLLKLLCENFERNKNVEQILRNISLKILENRQFFGLYDDELSYLIYDIEIIIYMNYYDKVIKDNYSKEFCQDVAKLMQEEDYKKNTGLYKNSQYECNWLEEAEFCLRTKFLKKFDYLEDVYQPNGGGSWAIGNDKEKFETNIASEKYITEWFEKRINEGKIIKMDEKIKLSNEYINSILETLKKFE